MKPLLVFLVFCTCTSSVAKAHEYKISIYEVRPVEGGVSLFARFDRKDILDAIYEVCEDYNRLGLCLESYMTNHMSLSFDGQKASYAYLDHTFKPEFVEINFDLGVRVNNVEVIEVAIDCLLEVDEDQENIIHFYFANKKRSFRLNKKRTKTKVVY